MNPELKHFEIFLLVAETKSITQAAAKLSISKAAVSRHIRTLEESTDLPLITRTTRRIELTETGEVLYQQCLRLQHELDNARNLISHAHQKPRGKLRIYANFYFTQQYLLPHLQTFTKQFPLVSIELYTAERMPDMQKEQIDLVFGVSWQGPLDVVAKKTAATCYVLCASPAYLNKHPAPKTLEDLAQHNYIAHIGRSLSDIIPGLKKQKALNLQPNYKFDNAQLMKDAALNNLGIVALHKYMVEKELKNGKLISLLPEYFADKVDIFVYYQKHRYVEPKIHHFIEFILQANKDRFL